MVRKEELEVLIKENKIKLLEKRKKVDDDIRKGTLKLALKVDEQKKKKAEF